MIEKMVEEKNKDKCACIYYLQEQMKYLRNESPIVKTMEGGKEDASI